jgi:hypothetical protein
MPFSSPSQLLLSSKSSTQFQPNLVDVTNDHLVGALLSLCMMYVGFTSFFSEWPFRSLAYSSVSLFLKISDVIKADLFHRKGIYLQWLSCCTIPIAYSAQQEVVHKFRRYEIFHLGVMGVPFCLLMILAVSFDYPISMLLECWVFSSAFQW